MLKQKSNNPLYIDSYDTRIGRDKEFNKPSSIMESKIVCYLFTAFFALADFCCLQISWNTVQTSSPWVITLIALSCAVCLDVPLAIAGAVFKAYRQGLIKSKKDMLYIMIPSIAVFTLVFAFSLIFKIITRTSTFEEANSAGGLVNNLAVNSNPEESQSILFAALFNGIVPLATSISSFLIALKSMDPKQTKLNRLERKKKKIEGHLAENEQTLAEEDLKKNAINLFGREKDMFRQFVEEVLMVEGIRRQAANQALQEHLNTPDAVSVLSEYGAGVNKNYTGLEYEDSAKKIAEEFIENYNPIGVIFGNDDILIDTDISESAINLPSNNIEDSNETILEPYKTETKKILEAG